MRGMHDKPVRFRSWAPERYKTMGLKQVDAKTVVKMALSLDKDKYQVNIEQNRDIEIKHRTLYGPDLMKLGPITTSIVIVEKDKS